MQKKCIDLLKIAILAIATSVNYCIFVFPNKFAPAGIDGICTMIQDLFGINMGYLALFANIPLIIVAFVMLNHDYAIKSAVYIVIFSFATIFIKDSRILESFYFSEPGISVILSPIASGAIRGIIYAYTLSINGSAAGIDIISSVIKIKKPHLSFMDNVFIINTIIAIASYWVYDMNVVPVICSIIYAYTSSHVCKSLRGKKQENVKYEIITKNPEEVVSFINNELHEKATIVEAKGGYSHEATSMVLCIIGKNAAPFLENFLLGYRNCTVFKSYTQDSVSGITYK